MTKLELAWHNAAQRYDNTCRTGGTPEQRQRACDQAVQALDALLAHEHAELKRRAKRDTEQLDAVA